MTEILFPVIIVAGIGLLAGLLLVAAGALRPCLSIRLFFHS